MLETNILENLSISLMRVSTKSGAQRKDCRGEFTYYENFPRMFE